MAQVRAIPTRRSAAPADVLKVELEDRAAELHDDVCTLDGAIRIGSAILRALRIRRAAAERRRAAVIARRRLVGQGQFAAAAAQIENPRKI